MTASLPTPDLIETAQTIVAGSFRPWCFDSQIASAADWCLAAQCALDGDDSDLAFFWNQLEADRARVLLPDDESWKHDAAVAAVSLPIAARAA